MHKINDRLQLTRSLKRSIIISQIRGEEEANTNQKLNKQKKLLLAKHFDIRSL